MISAWSRTLLALALICPGNGLHAQPTVQVENGFPSDWWHTRTTGQGLLGTALFHSLERDFPKRSALATIDPREWRALLTAGYEPIGLVRINVTKWDSARVVRSLLERARDKGGDLIVFPLNGVPYGPDEHNPRVVVQEDRPTGRCLVWLPPIAKGGYPTCNVFETRFVDISVVSLAAMVFRLEPELARARLAGMNAEHKNRLAAEEIIAAVQRRDTTVLRAARDAGADLSTALRLAVDSNYVDIARWLLRRGVAMSMGTAYQAAGLGRVEILTAFLEGEVSADQLGAILIRAAGGGSPAAVRLLIKRGADVNYKEPGAGESALMHAAAFGRPAAPEVVETLLAAGADPNWVFHKAGKYAMSDYWDNASTPLAVATHAADSTLVQALLRRGADPALKGRGGRSALEISARRIKDQYRAKGADTVVARLLQVRP